ncbi:MULTISPECIES: sensor histidine kinase [Cellulosimicrobium]|uniref:histidine kinase n=1 Tax=Cellulosimicrobium sp. ES-005 TaxID=3163031 RepID=A0AAU8G0W9_9MICO|nr:sensor histidine kinase [Cellulosimicrobium cellulans]MCO7274738.1 sensor histidine kinase [Cellulosimicrobium cellulans]
MTTRTDCPPYPGRPVLATAAARRDGNRPLVPWWTFALAWLAVAALTVLATAGIVGQDDPGAQPAIDVAVAALALAVLPLLWSRSPRNAPVLGALMLASLAAYSGAATPASTVATLQVARWYPARTAVPVAVAGFLGHAVQALWRPEALPLGWWLLCDLAVHAALLGWGLYWQARAQLMWSLRDRARRAEAEQEHRVAEARVAERTRIAREMHDTLAHRLSLLAATAGALEYRPDADPAQLARAAGLVRAGVSSALGDLRDVVRVLRADPDEVDGGAPAPQPTLDDVDRLVAEARAAGGDVAYERSGSADVPRTVEVAAYRVAQEGLTNARRHAPGSPVVLRVTARAGEVRVTVSDGGPRLVAVGGVGGARDAAGEGTGTGLVGLRERVDLLGGTLDAGARDDGFVLDVRLPWDA